MVATKQKTRYVYGPVNSWRSGCSLGIDPIGEISTCSFNCVYCQLGHIQNITSEVKTYVPTQKIIDDLLEFEELGLFNYEDLDVITFAGSGEPTIAENLEEIIDAINQIQNQRIQEGKLSKRKPIAILTNATMFDNPEVLKRACKADQLSLKIDAPDDEYLKMINQPAAGINITSIIEGIKDLKKEFTGKLQLQLMFMPKYIKDSHFAEGIAKIIKETRISWIQINTPTRPKPLGKEYHIETRGNHPEHDEHKEVEDYDKLELPVISKEEAFLIEDMIRGYLKTDMPNMHIINVYKRHND